MSSGEKSEGADKPRGFAVSDRRSFTETGEAKAADSAPPPEAAAASQSAETRPADAIDSGTLTGSQTPREGAPAAKPPAPRASPRAARLPPVDFPTFVLSLGSSALMHLGEAPHPTSGETVTDLAMAKHTIDILSMLEEKTRGNLNASEAQLMENLLYDLRLRYVDATKK